MRTEKFEFPGHSGEMLAARLDAPDQAPRAYALFAHCFTCTKDIYAASRIARALTETGIAVVRFDFTGLGHSDGEFANTNFSSNVEDLIAAADHMRDALAAPHLIIGHSLGGAAVLAAAGKIDEVKAVVTIGAPAEPAHLAHMFQESAAEIEAAGEANVLLAGREFTIKKQFLDDIQGQTLTECLAKLGRALLVMHSPIDNTVGIENAAAIFAAAKHPKSFISLDDADHLVSRKQDAEYAATVLAAWASRYIPAVVASDDAGAPAAEGEVVVSETGENPFAQAISAGVHSLRADEPLKIGGGNTGPTPYDLLLSGLGACTSMTIRMYANRKKWPLEKAVVRLKHDKIHAEDCADCETRDGRVDRIERTIELTGDLDDEQRARLLEIADKCPVHRTLESEVKVETRLAG
tara:strand:- start:8102 stop:9325 length:1224 start_codon:yes stop_codon:yes gene_type:complete